jgi:outer membrane lipoprotein SlyB
MKAHYVKYFVALLALALGACASDPYRTTDTRYPDARYPSSSTYPPANAPLAYGTVESVELVRGDPQRIGLGAVAGAVIGGIVGNQIGSGSGRVAGTVGGAVAGGVVGNEVEKRTSNRAPGEVEALRITVRLNDGSRQVVTQQTPDVRIGDRVRIEGGRAFPY